MKAFFRRAIIVVSITLLTCSAAHAGAVFDGILKSGVLRVGITGDAPPLNATDKKGDIIGMDADIAGLIASNMNVTLKFVKMPFNQLLPALKDKKIDMIVSGLTMTMERNLDVAFIGPYYASGKGILTRTDKIAGLQAPGALNSGAFTVGVLKDSTSQRFVAQSAPNAKLVATETYDAAIGMLLAGKVDAVVADLPFCSFYAYRYQDKGLVAGESPMSFEPLAIAVREDALLMNWLDNFLKILKGSGALNLLHAKWFKDGSWISQLQ
ncbi:MAG: transporter substrate-binding domain-containing protein [Pseudomonadota bacterium]